MVSKNHLSKKKQKQKQVVNGDEENAAQNDDSMRNSDSSHRGHSENDAKREDHEAVNHSSVVIQSEALEQSNSSPNSPSNESTKPSATSSTSSDFSHSSSSSLTYKSMTRRQVTIIGIVLSATLTSSFAVCLFPPFFPKIAEEKGSSATEYGFIIGTNCLMSFLVTPVIGKNLGKIGVRFALLIGIFVSGVCCILSGSLEFFTPGWEFIVCAVLIRMVHATGNACVITSTFTYSAIEFHSCVGRMFSWTRTAMNLAQLFGPSIGGALYGLGSFYLPFVSMGSVQLIMFLFSIKFLPECKESISDDEISIVDNEHRDENDPSSSENESVDDSNVEQSAINEPREDFDEPSPTGNSNRMSATITLSSLVKIKPIWYSFTTFVVATTCNGFLSINLEPQVLRKFELSPFYVGIIFGLKDGANSVASPIWGYLCDRSGRGDSDDSKCSDGSKSGRGGSSVKCYIMLSALFVALSFFLLGSSSVISIHIPMTIGLVTTALIINGIGIGGEQVAGVIDALKCAMNAGYADNPDMHGLVSGMWSSFSGAGRFVSRAGSGILVDNIGFNFTAACVTVLQLIVVVISLVMYYTCDQDQVKKSSSTRTSSSSRTCRRMFEKILVGLRQNKCSVFDRTRMEDEESGIKTSEKQSDQTGEDHQEAGLRPTKLDRLGLRRQRQRSQRTSRSSRTNSYCSTTSMAVASTNLSSEQFSRLFLSPSKKRKDSLSACLMSYKVSLADHRKYRSVSFTCGGGPSFSASAIRRDSISAATNSVMIHEF